MKGFRIVFVSLVPLMGLCVLGNCFVRDTVLQGDSVKEKEKDKGGTEGAQDGAGEKGVSTNEQKK